MLGILKIPHMSEKRDWPHGTITKTPETAAESKQRGLQLNRVPESFFKAISETEILQIVYIHIWVDMLHRGLNQYMSKRMELKVVHKKLKLTKSPLV